MPSKYFITNDSCITWCTFRPAIVYSLAISLTLSLGHLFTEINDATKSHSWPSDKGQRKL